MDNYYEILEVSKSASKEVIEKAYKVIVKRYHPDLQEESKKKIAEEKMKLINEAYEILSDDEKRKNYDIELMKIEKQRYETIKQQNENIINNEEDYYNEDDDYYEEKYALTKEEIKQQKKQEKREQREYQEEQDRIYRNYMRSLGYKVKEKWTLKKFIRLLKVLGILFIAILIIWFFPPTHKVIIQTYEENQIIRVLADTIINMVKGLGNGIANFFKSIFM